MIDMLRLSISECTKDDGIFAECKALEFLSNNLARIHKIQIDRRFSRWMQLSGGRIVAVAIRSDVFEIFSV
jgi:hypothetical protein